MSGVVFPGTSSLPYLPSVVALIQFWQSPQTGRDIAAFENAICEVSREVGAGPGGGLCRMLKLYYIKSWETEPRRKRVRADPSWLPPPLPLEQVGRVEVLSSDSATSLGLWGYHHTVSRTEGPWRPLGPGLGTTHVPALTMDSREKGSHANSLLPLPSSPPCTRVSLQDVSEQCKGT